MLAPYLPTDAPDQLAHTLITVHTIYAASYSLQDRRGEEKKKLEMMRLKSIPWREAKNSLLKKKNKQKKREVSRLRVFYLTRQLCARREPKKKKITCYLLRLCETAFRR